MKKRRERSTDYDHHYGRKVMASYNSSIQERKGDDEWIDRSTCASAAVIKSNSDATMMTWTSSESPTSTKTKTRDDDSACQDGSRRRDMIYQKMKALQKLVPNASKTDETSMLDEVIDYLKQLQAQVQMFNRYMPQPQFMNPLGMQQYIHMSLFACMGMQMGMGMLDMSGMAYPAAIPQPMSTLVHPNLVTSNTTSTFGTATTPFLVPPVFPNPSMPIVTQKPINDPGILADPLLDPYNTMLAQISTAGWQHFTASNR